MPNAMCILGAFANLCIKDAAAPYDTALYLCIMSVEYELQRRLPSRVRVWAIDSHAIAAEYVAEIGVQPWTC